MIKTFLFFILSALSYCCHSQDSVKFENTYPEGIYLTKEDFLKKTPNENKELIAKSVLLGSRKVIDAIPDQCIFFYKENDKKVKKTFAICYKGNLYFQALSILTNRDRRDKSQTTNFPNSFCRVIIGGQNFLYTELDLANSWKQGFGYGMGGVAGAAIAANAIKGKGIAWDFKNGEFNIFRSCKDFNEFIADKYPEGVQECNNQQPDILLVRTAMEMIK
ncbi:hypothetical protein [Sphingobacterium pedocola]|uniref:Lipoprotein n=1 Tax=Sphingobacterium pedocola TaxID=2082722 RepID=A0ABR9T9A8_9SPHI|nr:hypothetical protein [Sphingobacterium pedocola]MBE8721222.1 hypothetical protein [Sphingobacterium pedocola]